MFQASYPGIKEKLGQVGRWDYRTHIPILMKTYDIFGTLRNFAIRYFHDSQTITMKCVVCERLTSDFLILPPATSHYTFVHNYAIEKYSNKS